MNNFLKFLGFCDGLEMGDNTKAAAIRYFCCVGGSRSEIITRIRILPLVLDLIFDGLIALYSEHGVVVKNYVKFQAEIKSLFDSGFRFWLDPDS